MKDISGWEGQFAVTKDGKIWSYWKCGWLALNTTRTKDWYLSVSFGTRCRGNRKGYKVHRLVAQTFIPNPDNLKEVNHKNGDKTDNRVENLEWCTRKYNLDHARKNGWIPEAHKGESNYNHKLTEQKVYEIRKRYTEGFTSHRKLAREYGVSSTTIRGVILRWYWAHVG